jgi:hypothetical protein
MAERDLAGNTGNNARKPGLMELAAPKKGARPKRTGHTLLVAAQYIQKTPKNNGFNAFLRSPRGE